MPFDIISVQGFAFFMVVMATGYSYVEIFFGDAYPLRASMCRYGANLFDRLMHYVLAGVVLNVLYLILFILIGAWAGLVGHLNATGAVAEALMGGPGPAADSFQFVVFSVLYFGIVTWIPTAILGTLWLWRWLSGLAFWAFSQDPRDDLPAEGGARLDPEAVPVPPAA